MTARKIAAREGSLKKKADGAAPGEKDDAVERRRARRKARRKKAAREADGTKKRSRGRGKKKRPAPPAATDVAAGTDAKDQTPTERPKRDRTKREKAAPERKGRRASRKRAETLRFPERVGRVIGFESGSRGCRVAVEAGVLCSGDALHVRGEQTDFYERVERIERDGAVVTRAVAGDEVVLTLTREAREGDILYLLSV